MSSPSERWRAVDGSDDAASFVRFLDRTSTGPGEAYPALNLLELAPGRRCLDVGCGLGADARSIAEATGASVLGVDLSVRLTKEAHARATDCPGLSFAVADGARLPLPDATFDAASVKRTFMHLLDSERVMGEMARVVRPGGRIVAVEPDSEILLLDSGLVDVTRRVLAFRAAGYANPWSGRQLRRLMRGAGLVDVQIELRPHDEPGLAVADRCLHLLGVARAAAEKGLISAEEARAWAADLDDRDRRGEFTCLLLLVVAAGRVPAA